MSINRRQIIKATGAGSALAILGSRDVFAQAQNVITFGGSIPMSGKEGDTGLNVLQGYKVAVQFINEKLGGVRIGDTKYTLDLQMFDDASDPQRATTLIQKQVDAGIDFFLGSFSSAIVFPARRNHRAGKEADGASRRGIRSDLHQEIPLHVRHVSARLAAASLFDRNVEVDGRPGQDLLSHHDERSILQNAG